MVIERITISREMIDRLLQLFKELNKSLGEVATDSGVTYDTLNQIRYGRVKTMRCDTLAAIIKAYPSINANYILTGEGRPFLETSLTDETPIVYLRTVGNVEVKIESK